MIEVDYIDSTYQLKLVHPASDRQALPYAALADAQGTENTLRLLSSNIEQLGGGMDLADLPPMVQDAVIVAQKLGYGLDYYASYKMTRWIGVPT